mmetsp:Transcript_9248/g.30062  ORF Transcript_9248/g.30062 Transcript_9248/m.30062 type:complete len:323 (-) Transcript_9248:598-1566(-)
MVRKRSEDRPGLLKRRETWAMAGQSVGRALAVRALKMAKMPWAPMSLCWRMRTSMALKSPARIVEARRQAPRSRRRLCRRSRVRSFVRVPRASTRRATASAPRWFARRSRVWRRGGDDFRKAAARARRPRYSIRFQPRSRAVRWGQAPLAKSAARSTAPVGPRCSPLRRSTFRNRPRSIASADARFFFLFFLSPLGPSSVPSSSVDDDGGAPRRSRRTTASSVSRGSSGSSGAGALTPGVTPAWRMSLSTSCDRSSSAFRVASDGRVGSTSSSNLGTSSSSSSFEELFVFSSSRLSGAAPPPPPPGGFSSSSSSPSSRSQSL